jgi:2-phosphoglycerate kinase
LIVHGPDGPRPFMRGILVQSLVSRGVPFEVALDTATEIRDRIAARGEVTRHELAKLVEDLLDDRFDLDPSALGSPKEVSWVRDSHDLVSPFSKGVLAISLQGSGMEPSEAYDTARDVETRLLRRGLREVDRHELRDMVAETIERTHGPRAADRYRVWRRAVQDGRPIFLLLGGSTGTGKTSIAVEVSRRLEISRVLGTDSIRQIMRLMFSKDLMPEIHCSTYEVHKVLRPGAAGNRDPVIAGYFEQAQRISVGVQAMLDRGVEENTSILLEGVNLLPGLLDLDRYRDRAHVISLVVACLDVDSYRSRFRSRAAKAHDRAAEKYLEHFEAIVAIQNCVLSEADHYGLPIIDNVRLDDTVQSVTRTVIETLRKSMDLSSDAAAPEESPRGRAEESDP